MGMFIFSDDIARRVIGIAVTETLKLLEKEFSRHCDPNGNWDRSEKILEYKTELSNLLSESNKLKNIKPEQPEVKF